MQHTLIAVFDNRNDAENAMNELLSSGFSRQEVKLSQGDATGATDSLTGTPNTESTAERHDEGVGASIRHWFSDIFGTDNSDHAQRYSEAVTRGHHVLTVEAADEPEVERAADIVERYGPVDIDEKAAEWAGGAAIARPESMRMSGAGGMQQSGALSQQSTMTGDDRNLYQQQSLNDPTPMGTTYQEPMSGGGNLSSGTTTGASLQGSSLEGSAQKSDLSGSALQGSSSTLTGSQQRDTSTMSSTTGSTTGSTGTTAIPVVEEQLKVGKREVQRGGVRVFSRVVETPVNESIGLREEHVNVERHRVDQPISTTDTTAFKEQEITLRETAEEAVVEKSARVVEEVVVGKQVSERQEQIKDTVRHTEVEVEQLGGTRSAMSSDDDYYRKHWQSKYGAAGGSYDDYAPAYSYGSQMASSEKYRGRPWNDVETDLRSGWDTRGGSGGGASTWEKMKDAVKGGWDRMTGDTGSDSEYRSHWSTNYSSSGSSYDDYLPAYRYGNEMRSNPKYSNRQWDDVESDLRTDWDTRYGSSGASTWEKMKAAVRHGWDKMKS
jgi:uncharacterized protein (TIGR02271 family)